MEKILSRCEINEELRSFFRNRKNNKDDINIFIFLNDDERIDDIIIGDLIGEGQTRKCHNIVNNEYLIIKNDKNNENNACYREFLFWCLIKDTKYARFFVPCVAISSDGKSLLMKKAITKFNINLYLDDFNYMRTLYPSSISTYNCGIYNTSIARFDYVTSPNNIDKWYNKILKKFNEIYI